jgi:hypothetical protein
VRNPGTKYRTAALAVLLDWLAEQATVPLAPTGAGAAPRPHGTLVVEIAQPTSAQINAAADRLADLIGELWICGLLGGAE